MTHLAVNDTPLSRRLLQQGRLEVDRFETSGPLTESAVETSASTNIPLLLHNGAWNWSLAHPEVLTELGVLYQTQQRLALTGAPWLSTHLGYSAAHVTFTDGMHPDSASPLLTRSALLTTVVHNLRTLQDATKVPLLIENLDYNPTGAYEHVCEAAFIAEVLVEADVGLLLDLAHAQVSASRFGEPVQTYLAKLPLERVRQLHVSGPRLVDNTLKDTHEPLREEDYGLLADVLQETAPWAVTLEYGKDEQALREQLHELRRLVNR